MRKQQTEGKLTQRKEWKLNVMTLRQEPKNVIATAVWQTTLNVLSYHLSNSQPL